MALNKPLRHWHRTQLHRAYTQT